MEGSIHTYEYLALRIDAPLLVFVLLWDIKVNVFEYSKSVS